MPTNELLAEIAYLREQNATLTDEIDDLNTQLANLHDKLDENESTISALQAQVQGMREMVQWVADNLSPREIGKQAQSLLSSTPAGEFCSTRR